MNMSDKKEITHEELLELVSGGSLKYNYQANLDEMMAKYETINTKEEFLAGFEKRWREHIGTAYLKDKFSNDLSEEDLQECLRYINENYEYKEQIFY
jgi:DNA mismatch repair ATPase MutS